MKQKILLTGLCALSTLLVSACEPGVAQKDLEQTKATLTGYTETTNARLMTAAKQAARDGNPAEAMSYYERLYKKDSSNPQAALYYAQVLRETGNPARAVSVLSPFVEVKSKNSDIVINAENPDILLEYASSLLATGQYERAETILQEIKADPASLALAPQVHNLIGLSLDARGRHNEAEPYYRQAIEMWEGQPVTVMNNLGLNLAHRGYFDEALNQLRQALVMDPSQEKIATNIRLVTALQKNVIRQPAAPKPLY